MESPLLVSLWIVFATGAGDADAARLFREQIAPIFEIHCVRCHQGPKPKGGLSLVDAAAFQAGGNRGSAVDPDHAAGSLLLALITGDKPAMPKSAPPLSPAEVGLIRKWIHQGAVWPPELTLKERKRDEQTWWSLEPLKKPVPPKVDSAWPKNPIDQFVFAKQEEMGLRPAPQADRRTLVRRLTFDLWGLPPDPETLRGIERDPHPEALDRWIDTLLASPHYGERWGRHWLDVVHYGDTHGFDKDKRREHAWPYRDYVIGALNADKPYGRFVQEQVAGDVVFPNDPQAVVATGFLAAGPWDFVGHVELREGTVDKQITRLLDRDDFVMNTMATFTSTTVHCARCHDHPYDPIPQDDYYRLQAVFAGIDRGDRERDDPGLRRQREHIQQKSAALQQQLEATIAQAVGPTWQQTHARLAELRRRLDRSKPHLADAKVPADSPTNGYHGKICTDANTVQWVQIDLGRIMPIDSIHLIPARPTDFPDTPGFGFPVRYRIEVANDAAFVTSSNVVDQSQDDVANPGDLPVNFWLAREAVSGRYVRITATRLWRRSGDYVFAFGECVVLSGGRNAAAGATVTALDSIEAGRWSTRHLVDGRSSRHPLADFTDVSVVRGLRTLDDNRQEIRRLEQELSALKRQLDASSAAAEVAKLRQAIDQSQAEFAALPTASFVYAVRSMAPRPIHVLHRGDVTRPSQPAEPGALRCVRGLPHTFRLAPGAPEGSRRAALAAWLADPRNPLTWRSIVNRVWHFHFGRGLVDTPNDFGRLGALPSHPELLDWLACEFLERGQSLKWLHKTIVSSATYQQASQGDAAYARIDTANRYLWRMNRRRLDAEAIRDAVLAVSGKLDRTMGGPGFDLFTFKDDHSPHYLYEQHDVDAPGTLRRTVYRFVVRSVPDPFLECLDCADPSLNVPARDETLTALQALSLLNHPFMVRQAEHFAKRLAREAPAGLAPQLRRAGWLALGREVTAAELDPLTRYAQRHGLAAACRLLLNSNEFLFVD